MNSDHMSLLMEITTEKSASWQEEKEELGYKNWDRGCTRKKREVKKIYNKWRKRIDKKKYINEKKKMRNLFVKKQKERRRAEKEELRKVKNETEV